MALGFHNNAIYNPVALPFTPKGKERKWHSLHMHALLSSEHATFVYFFVPWGFSRFRKGFRQQRKAKVFRGNGIHYRAAGKSLIRREKNLLCQTCQTRFGEKFQIIKCTFEFYLTTFMSHIKDTFYNGRKLSNLISLKRLYVAAKTKTLTFLKLRDLSKKRHRKWFDSKHRRWEIHFIGLEKEHGILKEL